MIKMYKAYCRATWNPGLTITRKLGEALKTAGEGLKTAGEVIRLAGVIGSETYELLKDKDVEEIIEHNMRFFRIRTKEDFASWTESGSKFQVAPERIQELMRDSSLFN